MRKLLIALCACAAMVPVAANAQDDVVYKFAKGPPSPQGFPVEWQGDYCETPYQAGRSVAGQYEYVRLEPGRKCARDDDKVTFKAGGDIEFSHARSRVIAEVARPADWTVYYETTLDDVGQSIIAEVISSPRKGVLQTKQLAPNLSTKHQEETK